MFSRFVTMSWLGTGRRVLRAAGFRGTVLRQMVPAAGVMAVALGQQVMALASSSSAKKPPTEDKPFVVKSDRVQVRWTSDEDQRLREGVKEFGPLWTKISEALLPHRKPHLCCQRWTQVLDPKVKNGIWTAAEDARLTNLVGEFGEGRWTEIAKHMDGRSGVACRNRWTQLIDPSLNHGPWSNEEDAVLLKEYALHPNKWVIIKESLPGRNDMSILLRYKHLTRPDPDHIRWTNNEDDLLTAAVDKHTTRDWAKVALEVPGRNREQCKDRWVGYMAHHGKTKAAWSPEYDALLKKRVEDLGTDGKWAAIAAGIPGKTGQECKSRWERVVFRDINTDPWSTEEDATIKRMREEGKHWNVIFSHLLGRDKDAIKRRCKELGYGIKPKAGRLWTADEIAALHDAILPFESQKKNWNEIAKQVSGRTAMECRKRYWNEQRTKP